MHRYAPALAAGAAARLVESGLRVLTARYAAGRRVADRVAWTRIAYRQHFRPPAALREIRHANGARSWELAVDLGQIATAADLACRITATLDGPWPAPGVDIGGYTRLGANPMWAFNAAFWNHMPGYMAAAGRGVRDSIGGSPDSDPARMRDHAHRFRILLGRALDRAGNRNEPGQAPPLAYLDVGVADTGYAEAMIGHLASARLHPVHYLVADRSAGALQRARARLGSRRGSVSIRYLPLDLAQPAAALAAYRGRILTAHLTNLLDNLPGEELVQVDGRSYLLHACLYLPARELGRLARRHRLDPDRLAADLRNLAGSPDAGASRFLAHYRDRFTARGGAGAERDWFLFWQDLFGNPDDRATGLKLRERLVEVPDAARIVPWPAPAGRSTPLELPAEVLAPGPDRRIPLSDRAIGACLRLIGLLHPLGVLEITDVMIRDRRGAAPYASYHGPAKYDGAVVNWFNGGLLVQLARRAFPGCRAAWRSLADAGKAHMTTLEVDRGGR